MTTPETLTGRELDCACAAALGLHNIAFRGPEIGSGRRDWYGLRTRSDGQYDAVPVPPYSTDIADAFSLVETGFRLKLADLWGAPAADRWEASLAWGDRVDTARGATAAEVIARAFLAASSRKGRGAAGGENQ